MAVLEAAVRAVTSAAFGKHPRLFQAIKQQAAVGQMCKGVMESKMAQLVFKVFLRRDVALNGGEIRDIAQRVFQRNNVHVQPKTGYRTARRGSR